MRRFERLAPCVRLPSWPGRTTPLRRAGDTSAFEIYPPILAARWVRLLAGGVQIREVRMQVGNDLSGLIQVDGGRTLRTLLERQPDVAN